MKDLLLLLLLAGSPTLTMTALSPDEHSLVLSEATSVRVRASRFGDGCSRCRCGGVVTTELDATLRRVTVTMPTPEEPATQSPCRALPITSGEVVVGPLEAGAWTIVHPGLSIDVDTVEPKRGD